MSKLIYAKSFAAFKNAYGGETEWFKEDNECYRAVAYTADGYIITHGKAFQTSVAGSTNPYGLGLSLIDQTLSVTISGTTKEVTIPVINITGDGKISVNSTNGVFSLTHNDISGLPTAAIGSIANSVAKIPVVTVDSSGHVSSLTSVDATLNLVKQSSSTAAGYMAFTLSDHTNDNDSQMYYNTNISVDTSGVLSAKSFKENGTSLSAIYAPISHASSSNKYGLGTSSLYGHVKLSDSITSTSGESNGIAATPNAVRLAIEEAKKLFASNDAMVFVGTIDASTGKITSSNAAYDITEGTLLSALKNYSAGWTFRVSVAGLIDGIGKFQVGDMLVCITDYSSAFNTAHWSAIQANIDGAITADSDLSDGQLLVATGTHSVKKFAGGSTGQVLKWNGNKPEWSDDKNDTWRPIKVNGTEILGSATTTGSVNFAPAIGSGITIFNGGDDTIRIGSFFHSLEILNGDDYDPLATYSPTQPLSISYANGLKATLSGTKVTVGHSASVTTTVSGGKLYAFTYDTYGHLTTVREVTSLKNPKSLTFGSSSRTDTYDGSSARTFKISVGTVGGSAAEDFSMTSSYSNGTLTLTPSLNRRYRSVGYYATNAAASVTSAHTNTNTDQLILKPGNSNVKLGWDTTAKAITISTENDNTWRQIKAPTLKDLTVSAVLGTTPTTSLDTRDLEFNSDFVWTSTTETDAKIGIVWTEINESGVKSYAV